MLQAGLSAGSLHRNVLYSRPFKSCQTGLLTAVNTHIPRPMVRLGRMALTLNLEANWHSPNVVIPLQSEQDRLLLMLSSCKEEGNWLPMFRSPWSVMPVRPTLVAHVLMTSFVMHGARLFSSSMASSPMGLLSRLTSTVEIAAKLSLLRESNTFPRTPQEPQLRYTVLMSIYWIPLKNLVKLRNEMCSSPTFQRGSTRPAFARDSLVQFSSPLSTISSVLWQALTRMVEMATCQTIRLTTTMLNANNAHSMALCQLFFPDSSCSALLAFSRISMSVISIFGYEGHGLQARHS